MSNIFDTYIPKFLVTLKNKENDDLIFVSSSNFSANGDVYILDTRTVSPNVIATIQSLNNLQPDVSDIYPFKVVTPLDVDGLTIVYTPTLENEPTASQHYYAPLYFERYRTNIINAINKEFTELTIPEPLDIDIAPQEEII
jgi:hypothetical protein